ncbi:MAG: succinate dehydrogenase [Burkholderiales bacterium]|nr:succinate dehydrogenase [Burkholderiales bacterium]
MNTRTQVYLWAAQRMSAVVLAVCVLVHLGTLIYAVQGGLSATEILGRSRGSAAWAAFYGVFVLAVAVHAPIGLRSVLAEWLGWRGTGLDALVIVVALAIAALGMRALWAVIA